MIDSMGVVSMVDIFTLAGFAAFVYGLYLWDPALALVIGGGFVMLFSLTWSWIRTRTRRQTDESGESNNGRD